ncbi:MAG: hypothetical protein IJW78_05790 [Clostridia bacterium]|nr:hypothetical protein [Clostridia bacterium]
MSKMRDSYNNALFEAILALKNVDECSAFFEDLCTIKEIQSMAQRFVVAKMLTENCVYSEIVEKTGASTATISRVNRSLNYGNDGYNMVLQRMKKDSKNV